MIKLKFLKTHFEKITILALFSYSEYWIRRSERLFVIVMKEFHRNAHHLWYVINSILIFGKAASNWSKITFWLVRMAKIVHKWIVVCVTVCCLKWDIRLCTCNHVAYFKHKSIFGQFSSVPQTKPNYRTIFSNGFFICSISWV